MITAIVLIDADVRKIPEVAQALTGVETVSEVFSVTGDVDLIAIVRVKEHQDLATVIPGEIARVDGVKSIKTYLAFQEFSASDLEAAYDIGLD